MTASVLSERHHNWSRSSQRVRLGTNASSDTTLLLACSHRLPYAFRFGREPLTGLSVKGRMHRSATRDPRDPHTLPPYRVCRCASLVLEPGAVNGTHLKFVGAGRQGSWASRRCGNLDSRGLVSVVLEVAPRAQFSRSRAADRAVAPDAPAPRGGTQSRS
jgi:hypothetical protein